MRESTGDEIILDGAKPRKRRMNKPSENYFTTGQAAKIADVTQKTIIAWIEEGRFKAIRIGRGPRKILKGDFRVFLTINGFPTDLTHKTPQGVTQETRPHAD